MKSAKRPTRAQSSHAGGPLEGGPSLEPGSIHSIVRSAALVHHNKLCVTGPDGSFTFREFYDHVLLISGELLSLGIGPGDRVATLEVNTIAHLETLCALGVIGAVAVPLNYRLRLDEWSLMLTDSEAHVALLGSRYLPSPPPSVIPGGTRLLSLPELWERALSRQKMDTGMFPTVLSPAPWLICYTSGTTGRPKGAVVTQGTAFIRALTTLAELRVTSDDVMHACSPLFHSSHLNVGLVALLRGMTQVMLPQFQADETLRAIRDNGVTFLRAVPTMLGMMMQSESFPEGGFGRVRLLMYAASPMSRSLLRELMDSYSGDLIQFYGQTEDLPLTVLSPSDHRTRSDASRLHSVGRPCVGVELQVVDDEGRLMNVGQTGEIVARDTLQMEGYWGLEEATSETLQDGWVHTGDRGYIDKGGYVFLVGRKTEMIIRGAENVYPAEVEEVLLRASGVRDCAVIGVPDTIWGERVVAVVVREDSSVTEKSLRNHCRRHLASFKCPERIVWQEHLPRNAAGKIMRQALVTELVEGLGTAPSSDGGPRGADEAPMGGE